MPTSRKINSALISVFYKDGLEELARLLHELNVTIYSTGGTQVFLEKLGIPVVTVESLTGYPSILGGRVKTLHPKVFGGILGRRDNDTDVEEMKLYKIPSIDLVVVDLYPFEETVKNSGSPEEIIEKIDIGGVSLIRAAAKNFTDSLIVSDRSQYGKLLPLLKENAGITKLEDRRSFAAEAFAHTAKYDGMIASYFSGESERSLRYGENPHQKAVFKGNLDEVFTQLNGKELSYNNLADVDAALQLIADFDKVSCAVIKHTNPCGFATRDTAVDAWKDALAGDPVSAFGGIIALNANVDKAAAEEINKIFFEVLCAPSFDADALEILRSKKNRILLELKNPNFPAQQVKTILNGSLLQDRDNKIVTESDFQFVTERKPTAEEISDMLFANRIVRHAKSNTIVLAKDGQLKGIGCGQTSRLDALKNAITKASEAGFDLNGAVMASDAFFPFPDCVEIAYKAGIKAVIQPGGSVNDKLSIDYCNANGIAMVCTGFRHFKH